MVLFSKKVRHRAKRGKLASTSGPEEKKRKANGTGEREEREGKD